MLDANKKYKMKILICTKHVWPKKREKNILTKKMVYPQVSVFLLKAGNYSFQTYYIRCIFIPKPIQLHLQSSYFRYFLIQLIAHLDHLSEALQHWEDFFNTRDRERDQLNKIWRIPNKTFQYWSKTSFISCINTKTQVPVSEFYTQTLHYSILLGTIFYADIKQLHFHKNNLHVYRTHFRIFYT